MEVIIMVCIKKEFVQDKWVILGPKMAHLITPDWF